MTPLEYLTQLQAEAKDGFHKDFGWVDDRSSAARVLRKLAEIREERLLAIASPCKHGRRFCEECHGDENW